MKQLIKTASLAALVAATFSTFAVETKNVNSSDIKPIEQTTATNDGFPRPEDGRPCPWYPMC